MPGTVIKIFLFLAFAVTLFVAVFSGGDGFASLGVRV